MCCGRQTFAYQLYLTTPDGAETDCGIQDCKLSLALTRLGERMCRTGQHGSFIVQWQARDGERRDGGNLEVWRGGYRIS